MKEVARTQEQDAVGEVPPPMAIFIQSSKLVLICLEHVPVVRVMRDNESQWLRMRAGGEWIVRRVGFKALLEPLDVSYRFAKFVPAEADCFKDEDRNTLAQSNDAVGKLGAGAEVE